MAEIATRHCWGGGIRSSRSCEGGAYGPSSTSKVFHFVPLGGWTESHRVLFIDSSLLRPVFAGGGR